MDVQINRQDTRHLLARLRNRLLRTRQDGPFTLQARAWAVKGVVLSR